MDFYVPPVIVVLGGIVTAVVISSMRPPLMLIIAISLLLIGYTVYLHLGLFSMEYKTITIGEALKSSAPTILISAVILMSIGYIMMLRSGTATAVSTQPSSLSTWGSYFSGSAAPASTRQPNFSSSERRDYISALNRLI